MKKRPSSYKPRVVAIIQARMGATRLPGKVLAPIEGDPMLAHVVRRTRRARLLDEVVVATSNTTADDAIADFCKKERIPLFRGSESDVLDRYFHAAKTFKADVIVRITADCPLMDPMVIDHVCAAFFQEKRDYVTNTFVYSYPDGLDVEVFSFKALAAAQRDAKSPMEREHVTSYIRNSGRFSVQNVYNKTRLPFENMRWTVDEPADLDFVKQVFARLNPKGHFGMKNVLELLAKDAGMAGLNGGKVRNEGYYISMLKEPLIPANKNHRVTNSVALKKKAERLIPSCSQTFSKSPTQFVQGVAPVFLKTGHGCRVTDVDGNDYIDYLMGLGPLILGYSNPEVMKAASLQIKKGVTFSLPHVLEVELAELLTEIIPCAEMVRFGKNGSDATAGAVRAARGYTGRDFIACSGYHGWQDWYIGTTTRDKGVPGVVKNLTLPFAYNDLDSLRKIFREHPGQVAAVILEPVGIEEPRDGFLQKLCDLTHEEGALVIFDEIVTGFRWALGGAQDYFGVTPDLACFGKAMAGG